MKRFNLKFIILFLFLLTYNRDIKAQDNCATPDPTEAELQALPWYGNPNYLDDYIDSIKNAYAGNGTTIYQVEDRVRHRIPIHFWIFRGRNLDPNNILNDGETRDLPQERDLQFMIDDANWALSNTDWESWTRVYIACVDFIEVNDPEVSNGVLYAVTNVNYDPNAVNVYIRAGDGRQYYAAIGNANGFGYIALNRETYAGYISAKTFTHELGHFLDLPHTFLNHNIPCLREPVSRGSVGDGLCPPFNLVRRCSITGDLLCDTEADPKMEANQIGNCTYNDNEEDYRGDRYIPDPTNYMSYGESECRSRFTVNQVAVMLRKLNTRYSDFFSTPTSNNRFDTFEPNNTISGAENATSVVDRVIGSDADQVHSFHFNSCEGDWDREDWLPVELPNSGHTDDFTIRIEELDANTIGNVELFTSFENLGLLEPIAPPTGFTVNLVPAATNSWTITIPCNLLQRNSPRLYIRVTKANNTNFGTYRVTSSVLSEPELSFVSNDQKCANEDFEVQVTGILPSMSVSWSAEVVTSSTATSTVSASITSLVNGRAVINSSVEGLITIIATIRNSQGCEQILRQSIWVGKIPQSYLEIESPVNIDMQNLCPTLPLWLYGNIITDSFNFLDWDNVLEVEWLSSNPAFQLIPTPSTDDRRVTVIPPSTSYAFTNVTLRVRNECGWTEAYLQLRNGEISSSTCLGGIGRTMEVFPNPTKSDIKVVFKIECQDCTTEELENLYPKLEDNSIVVLNDAFGNERLRYIGKQIPLDINKNIHLNLSSLPFGNYVLKVITKEEVFFAHIIKE